MPPLFNQQPSHTTLTPKQLAAAEVWRKQSKISIKNVKKYGAENAVRKLKAEKNRLLIVFDELANPEQVPKNIRQKFMEASADLESLIKKQRKFEWSTYGLAMTYKTLYSLARSCESPSVRSLLLTRIHRFNCEIETYNLFRMTDSLTAYTFIRFANSQKSFLAQCTAVNLTRCESYLRERPEHLSVVAYAKAVTELEDALIEPVSNANALERALSRFLSKKKGWCCA